MCFFDSFFPFHAPFSVWILLGLVTGICQPSLAIVCIFLTLSCLAAYIIKNKTAYTTCALFALGLFAGNIRIASLFKSFSLNKPYQTDKSFIVQEIAKTGTSYWPYRITVKETSSGFSFFVFSKKEPSCLPQDTFLSSSLVFKQSPNKDFLRYLFKEGVQGTTFIKEFLPEVIVRPYISFWRWAYLKRKNVLACLKRKLSRPAFSFFCSLFIGDKKQSHYLTEKYKPFFKKWGISHQMARSGLHLIIFIFLWQLLLSAVPVSFLKKHFFLFVLCSFYFIITPSSISFIRAFFLFFFYKLCSFASWQIHTIHLLFLVASICLFYNPFQLFFLDFQLSFFLAFCLSWLAHINQQRRPLS